MNIGEVGINMRLDYTLYVLAALILITTAVPFIAPIGVETTEIKSLWVVVTVVLGIVSIGLGYTQRPKTAAQACQPAVEMPQEETKAPAEKAILKTAPNVVAPAAATNELTQVRGIGEKRAAQLKALGVNSVDDLSKASETAIAEKLKISPKIVDKWIDEAKELVK
jgi:predicted flap endonuclease-1-like 5' DNA nuclease